MCFAESRRSFYLFGGVSTVVLFEECWRLQISCGFPRVVAFGVPKPLDQVLQLFSPPLTSVAADGLDFVLFSPPHEVRWRAGVVFPVFFCFAIWGKKGGVKHWVNGPLGWQRQFVCHGGDHLSDGKGAVPPRG